MKKDKKLFWEVWKQRFEPVPAGRHGKPWKYAFGSAACGASLLFIFSASAFGEFPELMRGEEPQIEMEELSISIPGKTQLWNKKMADLVRQIIKNIPSGETREIGLLEFREAAFNQVTGFSRRLREDILIHLFQSNHLKVRGISVAEAADMRKQIAKVDGLDYYVSGFYKNESSGLSVQPQLVSASTGMIVYSGSSHFPAEAISAQDRKLLHRAPPRAVPLRVSRSLGGYEKNLKDLIDLKPVGLAIDVKLWTDKNRYGIGDIITFSVKTEKPGYLILLEISPSGGAKVIFPNPIARDNYIEGNVTHNIPQFDSGVEFKISGPIGKDRFKVLFSETQEIPLDWLGSEGFYTIRPGTITGEKDLKALIDSFSAMSGSKWAETTLEIFINESVEHSIRGTRPIPLVDKPGKPIDMIGTTGKEEPIPLVDKPSKPIDMIGTTGKEQSR